MQMLFLEQALNSRSADLWTVGIFYGHEQGFHSSSMKNRQKYPTPKFINIHACISQSHHKDERKTI
jgi:hypothetical protein